ncbi:MAG: hypothetical protein COA78_36645 [Blastopirellula sp.]|nr:MAG: hypothetical protein COA78_36645 [Blastopirellula sp.]
MFRAGSSSGKVLLNDEDEAITRPRVRKKDASGTTTEVHLATYESASDTESVHFFVCGAILSSTN